MHGCVFKKINLVKLQTLAMLANDPLKLNNTMNTSLYNAILFY